MMMTPHRRGCRWSTHGSAGSQAIIALGVLGGALGAILGGGFFPQSGWAQAPLLPQFQVNYDQSGVDATGFIGVDGWVPLGQSVDHSVTFLSAQLAIAAANHRVAAINLGYRQRVGQVLIGGYGGLDVRQTPQQTVPQLGLGLEVLGTNWDLHLNGYVPLVQGRSQVSSITQASNPRFQGNQLLIDRQQVTQTEVAFTALDLEAGLQLADWGAASLWGYGGVFYAQAPSVNGRWGGRLRLDYRLPQTLQLGLGIEHNLQGQSQILFSLGIPLNSLGQNSSEETRSEETGLADAGMEESADTVEGSPPSANRTPWPRATAALVRRSGGWLTTITDRQTATGVAALNPATGEAYQFRHVDPLMGTATGLDGAAETPRDTVANAIGLAVAGDIVYVQAGNGGGGFTIPDQVQVRSVGPAQFLSTQAGTVQLPGSGSGVLPTLSDTVTLGNHTLLSGFAITPPLGNLGIFGVDIDTVVIEQNQVTTAGDNTGAIRLTRADGDLTLRHNTLTTSGASTAFPNGAQGLQITWAGMAESRLSFTNNRVTTTGDNADGVYLQTDDSASVTALIAQNLWPQTGGGGLEIDGNDTSQQTVTITDNQIQNTGANDDGIFLDVNDNAQATFLIDNNTLSDIGGAIANTPGEGVELDVNDQGQVTLTLTQNQIQRTSGDGVFLNLDDRATVTATLTGNTLQATDDEAIHGDIEEMAQLRLSAIANSITTVNDDGIFLDIDGDAQVNATLQANTVDQVTQDGVDIDQNSTQSLCLVLNGNTSTNATENDFELDPNGTMFQIVDLSTVTQVNTGTVIFETGIANFQSVASCP